MSLSVQDWRHLLGYAAALVVIILGYVLRRDELVGAGLLLSNLAVRASAVRERDVARRERDDLADALEDLADGSQLATRRPLTRRQRDTLDRCKRRGP